MTTRVVVSWSGGKDSALMLSRLRRKPGFDVVALATTVDAKSRQVGAHGVSADLIERQATMIGLPLVLVEVPERPSNDVYVRAWSDALEPFRVRGVRSVAFGDIFLGDLRSWRERSFSAIGFKTSFPLWGETSARLAEEFLASGFSAVICCVNGAYLDQSYLGRLYSRELLSALPPTVDCCGENGEFHTFTFDGPIFDEPVRYVTGATTYVSAMRGSPVSGHWFCELAPARRLPRCARSAAAVMTAAWYPVTRHAGAIRSTYRSACASVFRRMRAMSVASAERVP